MTVIPRHLLPDEQQARAKRLHHYFPNQIVESVLTDKGWSITPRWAKEIDFYVDPQLTEGLHWWSQDLGVEDIPFAVKQKQQWQLSLNDSWTLFSWSKWLAAQNELPNEVVLLHIDDHDDLMSPLLWLSNNGWNDVITQQPVNLLKPETVLPAIKSGAIGIGSFIVPLLYQIPHVHIRHLCATQYSYTRRGVYKLEPLDVVDDLLKPDMLRPSARLQLASETFKDDVGDTSAYMVSSQLSEWLYRLPNTPTLLHIDLDYFNNRFNGDSDWEFHTVRHDPNIHQVLNGIDSVFYALNSQGIFKQIVNIAVALSPGFFPAEFWQEAIERIDYHIGKLWIDSAA
ncbi:MAG: hypothetical protein KME29_02670 [Calothrix sp. FI2-JRJ7]|jgi:hypothetical protein|nr:hypothetical protein [Calothrix sp. FI2-JRJ7]